MNGKVKVLLVVASLFCITSPALASASCQTKNDLKVCFYEKYTGISHHAWNISVEDLNGPPPDSINISTLIDSTNFPASKIHDAKLYSYENVTYTVPVFDHYKYVNGTLHDSGTVEDYNATHLNYTAGSNQTFVQKHRSPGAYDWSTADNWWTENESRAAYRNEERWEWRWQRAKEQYFKRNAERFTQGMGTFAVPPNPKWFRYEFDVPAMRSHADGGFGSVGRFALDINDVQFDPWFNTTWKYRRHVTLSERSGNDLTNYPRIFWFEHGGHANPDCSDIRVTKEDGETEIPFGLRSCNSTHVKLVNKWNVSANSDIDYYVYYGNTTPVDFANSSWRDVRWNRFFDCEGTDWDPFWTQTVGGGDAAADVNATYAYEGAQSCRLKSDEDGGNNAYVLHNYTAQGQPNFYKRIEFYYYENDESEDEQAMFRVRNTTGDIFFKEFVNDAKDVPADGNENFVYQTLQSGTGLDTGIDEKDGWYNMVAVTNSQTAYSWLENETFTSQKFYYNETAPHHTDYKVQRILFIDNKYAQSSYDTPAFYDNIGIANEVDPEPTYTVGAEETSPEIERVSVPDVHKGEDFLVRAKSFCIDAPCLFKDYNLTLELPSGFAIPDDELDHPNPRIDMNRSWVTTWEVEAPSATGTYLLNVSGPINEVSNEIRVKRNIFDIEDMIKTNITEELKNRWQELNATYLNKTELERQMDTRSIIKENLTKELQNRWQNLNASYLNGTAIERVRNLADYLNQTRWGSYIASDLYEISKKGKNISEYINQTRWLDKTASDLYDMSKQANSTAEAARKIADYINESRWTEDNATVLYNMAKEANSTAELARELADYINSSRWIDVNASELRGISVRARNLADYINGTRWGKYVAEDLRNMSDKARKIAEYINETRWKGFVAKDIFSEAESARKEAERTYEEMHDLKRVLIKEMRKTVLRALGIKSPGSHSSSSSSSGGSSSVPSSSPKTLPTGKATRSKSRGIVGKTVHFFARGVRGLSLIAQSLMGG